MAYPEYDPNEPSLGQTFADLLRGVKNPKSWQEVGQGIQNVAKVTPSVVESMGRGGLVTIPAFAGDVSQTARQIAPETMQNTFGNRFMPTSEEILAKVPRMTPDYQGSQSHEMMGGVLSPAMPSLLRAGAEATKGLPIGNMIAYHGTPHEIKGAFDISKVGTGEGAQAYGHGMYFAENPSVAGEYAKNLSNRDITNQGRLNAHANAQRLANLAGDPKYAADDLKFVLESNPNHEQKKLLTETLGYLESGAYKNPLETTGNLYKVDIPDKDIPNMLDWDKPINQQSNSVQNVAKELLVKIKKISPDADLSNMNGQQLYRLYQQYRGNNPDFASEGMNKLGIKGIRYLDEGSRDVPKYSGDIAYIHAGNDFKKHNYTLDDALSGMKQAYKNANVKELKDALNEVYGIKPKQTSNFVVFDPKEVKILEKNSKPVTRKEILEEQIKKIE